jgi:hypothetical protein
MGKARIILNRNGRKRGSSSSKNMSNFKDLVNPPDSLSGISVSTNFRRNKIDSINRVHMKPLSGVSSTITKAAVRKAIPHISFDRPSYDIINIKGLSSVSLTNRDRASSRIRILSDRKILRGITCVDRNIV